MVANTKELRQALVRNGWTVGTDLIDFESPGVRHDELPFARRAGDMLKYLFPPKQDENSPGRRLPPSTFSLVSDCLGFRLDLLDGEPGETVDGVDERHQQVEEREGQVGERRDAERLGHERAARIPWHEG
jgi:hypothetical protein